MSDPYELYVMSAEAEMLQSELNRSTNSARFTIRVLHLPAIVEIKANPLAEVYKDEDGKWQRRKMNIVLKETITMHMSSRVLFMDKAVEFIQQEFARAIAKEMFNAEEMP